MLNFIYYPVSWILWFWHEAFGYLLGPNNGFAWALAVIFLVATLRALLIKPFVGQVRSMRKMQEFQPQIKKLQEKYKNDKQKLGEEMQKLQKEHGVNPLNGCLPVFVQVPVFIGLFHVLRGFQSTPTDKFEPLYPYNYGFDHADIASFLQAQILGVRLTDSIAGGQAALGHISFSQLAFNPSAIAVCLPLMVISSVATHFTARVSQRNQSSASAANPQAAIMGKITMWLFPIGILIFGAFFPLAILLYWLSNNTWTLAQQHLVYKKINEEEAARRQEAREHRDTLGPKVGQKPVRQRGDAGDDPEDAPVDAPSVDATGEPVDAPSDIRADHLVDAPASERRASGRTSPGKVGSTASGARGSGSRSPGKLAQNGQGQNGQGQNGQGQNGQGQNGQGQNGQGQNGQGQNGQNGQAKGGQGKGGQGKGGQGKGGQGKGGGKKKGQLASSGRPPKRKK